MTNENWKDRKRAKGPENPAVDECVLKWFKQARDKKERNNISFKSVCGESGSVNEQAAGVWKSEVLKMIEETPAKDIFNVGERGLFYKSMPNKTLTFKGDRCSGGKNSKEPEVTDKPIPTSSESFDHLHKLQRYVEGQVNISESLIKALNLLTPSGYFTYHKV